LSVTVSQNESIYVKPIGLTPEGEV
jgi:hypothetical protein